MAKELSETSTFISSYWNYYLELEEAFKQTQKYVAFDRHNDRTYSVEYLKLIQAVCSEIDVVAKEIAVHFDPGFHKISRPNISHWGYVIVNNMPQITKACVFLTNGYEVTPWKTLDIHNMLIKRALHDTSYLRIVRHPVGGMTTTI